MKFEKDDIICYTGQFQDFIKERFIILDIARNGYYKIQKYPNGPKLKQKHLNSEWLKKDYIDSKYDFDVKYLRKKKLNKLNNYENR